MRKNKLVAIPSERIVSRIFLIRNKKVMIDRDLASLYGVKTKVLNQAVMRNLERFPSDFMFQLTKKELDFLRSHFVTLKSDIVGLRFQIGTLKGRGRHSKYLPRVFTEQGVAMLSSVLGSKRAIKVNIQIVRTFVKLRELMATNIKLREKVEAMEKKYDKQLKMIFEAIKRLLIKEKKPREEIGFEIKK